MKDKYKNDATFFTLLNTIQGIIIGITLSALTYHLMNI